MMAQVRKIVLRKKLKGDRIAGADAANRFQFGRWQPCYYVSEVAIVSSP
jgi:hypothetical protein